MIVVQNRLVESFDILPEVAGVKPVYRWGNEHHLIKLLQLFEKEAQSPYPLIYQISNMSSQNEQRNEVTVDLSLVLAVRNKETQLLNENRWAMTYKDVLFPLAKNIETLFKKSQVFRWDGEYKLYEFPNYGSGKENFTVDIWDALRFDTRIIITNNCLFNIQFD